MIRVGWHQLDPLAVAAVGIARIGQQQGPLNIGSRAERPAWVVLVRLTAGAEIHEAHAGFDDAATRRDEIADLVAPYIDARNAGLIEAARPQIFPAGTSFTLTQTCIRCGCTDDAACCDPLTPGSEPCGWAAPGLCTACFDLMAGAAFEAEIAKRKGAANG